MPVESGNNRMWRTGFTASLLASQGHEVVWWASNFSHAQKKFRKLDGDRLQPAPNYTIRFLPALGYGRNVSPARIKDHRFVADGFRKLAPDEPPPDVILASFPTIELCEVTIEYAQERDIPVVVDVRDQWPDLFYETAPAPLRPFVKLLCRGIERQANFVFRNATAVTGNAEQAMEWGLARGGRNKTEWDRSFPMGYAGVERTPKQIAAAQEYWREKGLHPEAGRFVVAYGGAVGKTGEFVIAGVGDELDRLRTAAAKLDNVIFTGWLGAPEMAELLTQADVGLVPYKDSPNFEGGITNKPIEYLAFGLPVLTTLRKGALREVLDAGGCGAYYGAGRPEELVKVIHMLLDKPDKRAEAARRARELYETQFRAEKVYGEMIEHLWKVHDNYRAGMIRKEDTSK
jgi:glycosyltransferase involved in cell wall biosynthesis